MYVIIFMLYDVFSAIKTKTKNGEKKKYPVTKKCGKCTNMKSDFDKEMKQPNNTHTRIDILINRYFSVT